MDKTCTHVGETKEIAPKTPEGCEECLKSGDSWTQLRMCLTCGHIGCCDSSKNKHANGHFEETKHPTIKAYKSSSEWKWCYVDKMYLQPVTVCSV